MHVVLALLMNCTSLYRVQRSVFFSKFLVSKQNLELGDTHLNFGATVDLYLTS